MKLPRDTKLRKFQPVKPSERVSMILRENTAFTELADFGQNPNPIRASPTETAKPGVADRDGNRQ